VTGNGFGQIVGLASKPVLERPRLAPRGELTSAGGEAAVRTLPNDKAVTASLCGNATLALGATAAWRRAGRAVGPAVWRSLATAIRRLITPS